MIQRLVAALAAVLLGASASAQICLGPDGLSGPNCWAPVPANLPQFDGFTLPGLNVCWIDCDPVSDCANVDVKTPAMIACGYYVADLAVLDCSGLPLLGGRLQLDYTRT